MGGVVVLIARHVVYKAGHDTTLSGASTVLLAPTSLPQASPPSAASTAIENSKTISGAIVFSFIA